MITLKDFLEVIDYQITEGWNYQWKCFGDHAYGMDYHDPDRSENSFTVVFDKKQKIVYCVEAHDYQNDRSYRLMHPDFAKAYKAECEEKGIKDMAWEDIPYTDLETEEDWLEKANAIFAGEPYDTRISIPIDLPDNELLQIFMLAHQADMTFNDYVEKILREMMSNEEFLKKLSNKRPV